MNRLEHVNLVAVDIDATCRFIQTAFPDWKIRGQGENDWYGSKRRWVHMGTDDWYLTLNAGNGDDNRDLRGNSPGLAHIGFVVDDVEAVTERLKKSRYQIATLGADHPYRKTVYFIDPSGFEFEFIQYLSEAAHEKNMYGGETSSITRFI